MKNRVHKLLVLTGLLGLLPAVALAEDTTTRYSRNADRGAWPVNGTVVGDLYDYGIGGDTRYTETPILHSDLTLLSELKSQAQANGKYIASFIPAGTGVKSAVGCLSSGAKVLPTS